MQLGLQVWNWRSAARTRSNFRAKLWSSCDLATTALGALCRRLRRIRVCARALVRTAVCRASWASWATSGSRIVCASRKEWTRRRTRQVHFTATWSCIQTDSFACFTVQLSACLHLHRANSLRSTCHAWDRTPRHRSRMFNTIWDSTLTWIALEVCCYTLINTSSSILFWG